MVRKAILVATITVGVMIVGIEGLRLLWKQGPDRTFAENFKTEVPKEATGFKGVLVGKVVDIKPPDKWSTSGWITVGDIRILSFSQAFKVSAADLTAAWKGLHTTIGAKDGTVKAPQDLVVGDWLVAECFQNEGHLRATKLVAYKTGEDEPNCYAFLKKEEKGNRVSLTLRKLGQEKTVTLALEKGADGKMVPKADLLNAVNALTPNTVIMVKLDHNVLKGLKPYEPPQKGEFVKVTTAKVGDKSLSAVEIKDDTGAAQTLPFIPGDSSELSRAARALRAGASIFYRTETDDKGVWLTRIWSAS